MGSSHKWASKNLKFLAKNLKKINGVCLSCYRQNKIFRISEYKRYVNKKKKWRCHEGGTPQTSSLKLNFAVFEVNK